MGKRKKPKLQLQLPEGHEERIWAPVARKAIPFPLVTAAVSPGRYGDCWGNAWALTKKLSEKDPERYAYCEGLATTNVTELPRFRANIDYPHAWVLDRHSGAIIECTEGWLEKHARYRGFTIPSEVVTVVFDRIFALIKPCSVIEALEVAQSLLTTVKVVPE